MAKTWDGVSVGKLCAAIVSRLHETPLETALIRNVRREFSKQIARWPGQAVFELGLKLLNNQVFVNRFVAYELISHHREALSSLDARRVERLGRGLDSWESVDTFALYLAGPVWRERQIGDELIHRWARSKDRWWRRAALVSTVPLNLKARGGLGDTARTLSVCSLLIDDRDDMVIKALSWALRALVVRDRRAVREFVAEHEGALATRVIREVRNKLATGLKNPRR